MSLSGLIHVQVSHWRSVPESSSVHGGYRKPSEWSSVWESVGST